MIRAIGTRAVRSEVWVFLQAAVGATTLVGVHVIPRLERWTDFTGKYIDHTSRNVQAHSRSKK